MISYDERSQATNLLYPFEQAVQVDAVAAAYFPASHAVHDVDCNADEYPCEHCEQLAEELSE